MVLSCVIASAYFGVFDSQNKQLLVYFEHAKTSLFVKLGQALFRDLNFGFVCMTVEGYLSVRPGQLVIGKKVGEGNHPSLLKNTMRGEG